jgi:hypothetical protein
VRADKPHPARSGSPPGQSGAERGVLGDGGDRVVEKLWKGREGDAIAAGAGERWGGGGGSASGREGEEERILPKATRGIFVTRPCMAWGPCVLSMRLGTFWVRRADDTCLSPTQKKKKTEQRGYRQSDFF